MKEAQQPNVSSPLEIAKTCSSAREISKIGTVRRVEKNGLWVDVLVESACASCHAKSVCLSFEKRQQDVFAYSVKPEEFLAGEKVRISMRRRTGHKAVRVGYVYPFVILLSSLLISASFIADELLCVIIALCCTTIYYLLVWVFRKKLDKDFRIEAFKLD